MVDHEAAQDYARMSKHDDSQLGNLARAYCDLRAKAARLSDEMLGAIEHLKNAMERADNPQTKSALEFVIECCRCARHAVAEIVGGA